MNNEPLRAMVDNETLGLRPHSPLVSVGAVRVTLGGVQRHDSYYAEFRQNANVILGRYPDPATIAWWADQPAEAQQVVAAYWEPAPICGAEANAAYDTARAKLRNLRAWLDPYDEVWACGPDFDLVMLNEFAIELDGKPLVDFRKFRCYRTLKNLAREVDKPERQGVHHNALDDAIFQAEHARLILRRLHV